MQLLHRLDPGSRGSGQCLFFSLAGQFRRQLPEQQHRCSSDAGGGEWKASAEVAGVRHRSSDSAVVVSGSGVAPACAGCLASSWQASTMSLGVGRVAGSHSRTLRRHVPQDSQPASTSLHAGTLHSDLAACTGSSASPGGSPRSFAMLRSISPKSCGVLLPRHTKNNNNNNHNDKN